MRLQDAGLNHSAPVRPGMDAGRANRAMDNFVWNKIEQPQADPQGVGQDARSTAHYSRYRDRKIIQNGLSPAQREAGARGEVPRIGAQGLAPQRL